MPVFSGKRNAFPTFHVWAGDKRFLLPDRGPQSALTYETHTAQTAFLDIEPMPIFIWAGQKKEETTDEVNKTRQQSLLTDMQGSPPALSSTQSNKHTNTIDGRINPVFLICNR